MKSTTLVIVIGSLGFIVIGLVYLLNKSIKEYFRVSGIYKDVDKFMNYNGKYNLVIGTIGLILGIVDNYFVESSKYTIIVYILVIFIFSIIQKMIIKKYKNI